MNGITIETIQNLRETNSKVIELIDIGRCMTDKQLNLLIEIIELCSEHPERKQFALEFTGKISELPEILSAM